MEAPPAPNDPPGGARALRQHHHAMSTADALSSATPLKFSSLTWHIDRAFWFKLSSLKLQVWKLDATPQPSTAFYTTPLRATDPGGLLELAAGAFDGTMYSFPLIIPHE